jgi:hypothetical protein
MAIEESEDTLRDPILVASLWPTFALRGWLTSLLVQTHQAELEMRQRIEKRELELDHMREQVNRSAPLIKSLEDSIAKVDNVLRRKLDAERARRSTTEAAIQPRKSAPATEGKHKK